MPRDSVLSQWAGGYRHIRLQLDGWHFKKDVTGCNCFFLQQAHCTAGRPPAREQLQVQKPIANEFPWASPCTVRCKSDVLRAALLDRITWRWGQSRSLSPWFSCNNQLMTSLVLFSRLQLSQSLHHLTEDNCRRWYKCVDSGVGATSDVKRQMTRTGDVNRPCTAPPSACKRWSTYLPAGWCMGPRNPLRVGDR